MQTLLAHYIFQIFIKNLSSVLKLTCFDLCKCAGFFTHETVNDEILNMEKSIAKVYQHCFFAKTFGPQRRYVDEIG